MSENARQNPHKILEAELALELWQKGKEEWNKWVGEHREWDISFADVNFSSKCDSRGNVSFENFDFGEGYTDFSGTKFDGGKVTFRGATFGQGEVSFAGASFGNCSVNFGHTRFRSYANFNNVDFGSGLTSFMGAIFSGGASFLGSDFTETNLLFTRAVFDNDADFGGSIFKHGYLDFSKVRFTNCVVSFAHSELGNGDISFRESEFRRSELRLIGTSSNASLISFQLSEFSYGKVKFDNANLRPSHINFSYAKFVHIEISFSHAKVGELTLEPQMLGQVAINAHSLSIAGRAIFGFPSPPAGKVISLDLQGASFLGPLFISGDTEIVPDLRTTKTSHQVELSDLRASLPRVKMSPHGILSLFGVAENSEDAARLRRLKEIAETNKDHQAALRFSADENRARRWRETPWLGSLLDTTFSAFSDYGQNILRPCLSLLFLTLTSSCLYKELANSEMPTWGHAAMLAASNSLPFLPQSRSLRDDAIEVLYANDPSLLVDAVMIGQGALSFIFLFLIGLGLRNRFRL